MANVLGIASGVISAGAATYSAIRQRKAAKEQRKAQEQMMEKAHDQQYDMWNKTNYGAQRKHLEEAGLNPGLIYGMGGGAGGQTGAGGVGSAAQENVYDMGANVLNQKMVKAQEELITAQAEKTKAETEKIETGDTPKAQSDAAIAKIDAEIRQQIGAERYAQSAEIEMSRADAAGVKQIRETEAWMDEAFDWSQSGELVFDKYGAYTKSENSMIKKVARAGLEHTVEQLNHIKQEVANKEKDGQIKQAEYELKQFEKVIREFEASLTNLGLSGQTAPIVNKLIHLILSRGK